MITFFLDEPNVFAGLIIALASLSFGIELPVFGKDLAFLKLVLPLLPYSKNHISVATVDKRPTPIPVVARGTGRFDELLTAHKASAILEDSASNSIERNRGQTGG